MRTKNDHIESLLSHYLDGELSAEQRKRFESHLATCAPCRQLLTTHRRTVSLLTDYGKKQTGHLSTEELIRYHERTLGSSWKKHRAESHLQACGLCAELLEAVRTLEDVEAAPEPAAKPSNPILRWLTELISPRKLVPAGLALAVAILVIVLLRPGANPYASLVEITPSAYIPAETRGEGAAENFRTGMEYYLNQDYARAADFLREAARREPDNPQFRFFYGVTLLLNQRFEQGLQHLTRPEMLNSAYRDEALWYAAQAALELNRPQKAREFLQQLVETSEAYSSRALQLLQSMQEVEK